MLNFEDLPDELILQIVGYSETKDLITYGQVSKRIRKISHDGTLWVTANLMKKVVKTELIEMILGKGCKILKISNTTIVGSLSSNMKSQLRRLELSLSTSKSRLKYYKENNDVLEELLFSCCSLQHLKIEGLLISLKMADSICKNGKTLQVLNLNHSHVEYKDNLAYTVQKGDKLRAIIKCCQELKELAFIDDFKNSLFNDDLEYLAKNISPNVVKLNLSNHDVDDNILKILLSRCKKIKVLILDATYTTSDSLKTIRQYLNLTLEELTLSCYWTVTNILELKSMPRLQMLNLYTADDKTIQNLRYYLPHLIIRTLSDDD